VLRNNGAASFSSQNVPAGADPRSVAFGDLDGDTDLDLVVANHDDRSITVHFNSGGSFGAGAIYSVGGQLRPEGVAIANFDGGTDNEVAVSTSGNGLNFISVFSNNGSGVLAGPFNYAVNGVDPNSIAAADLDCDNDLDIAVANETSSNLSILSNNGNGTFGAPMLLAVGVHPDSLVAADLNRDCDADLACSNRDSNNVSVIMNRSCPEQTFANNFTVTRGVRQSGGLTELHDSDDMYMVIQQRAPFAAADANVQLVVEGTSPTQTATSFTFRFEASTTGAPAGNVRQTLDMFNFQTNAWEQVDARGASSADAVVEVTITSNASRFIQAGTRLVRSRMSWFDRGVVAPNWLVRIDQTRWTIAP
jgi:hypothetical protein